MSAEAIAALHEELGFERWQDELRKVSGVWANLQNLRKKAKDAQGVKAYRSYLERCIRNLEAHDIEYGEGEVIARSQEWHALWQQRTADCEWESRSRRPEGVEAWCERWMPNVYEAYRTAMQAWLERASKRNFGRLMETTKQMFDSFQGTFASGDKR